MEKVLRCDCGYEVHADGDEALVAGIRRHALDSHGMELSAEDALRIAFRAELDGLTALGASEANGEE